jgi:hypothetical protein
MSLEPDRGQIELFVDALFRRAAPQGFAAVRSFFEDDDAKPARLSNAPLSVGLRFLIDVAEDDARRAAQHPRPIVFCPPLATFANKDRAREQDIAEGLALSVECDERPTEARVALEAILGPATAVVESGGRWANGGEAEARLHLHWRLAQPARGSSELQKLKQARDLAARVGGGDPSSKPVCHPIRWPGSWHRKSEPRLCRIAALDPDREIELDAALSALTAAAPEPEPVKPSYDNGGDPGDWPELVDAIVTGRSFHGPLVALSARLVGSNTHDGTAVKLLRALMLASTAERDTLRWQARYDAIPRIVATAREKFAEPQPAERPSPVELIWHGDADGAADEQWLVEDMLFEVGVALISGQWGTYKTFVAIDLSAAVMTGSRFAGKDVRRQGGVLWLAAEGQSQVKVRIDGVAAEKIAAFNYAENRTPIDPARTPFVWMRGCPKLSSPRAAVELRRIIAAAVAQMKERFDLPLALIVIDAMTSAALYKEASSSSEAALVMDLLNKLAGEFKLLVAVIDHYGKDLSTGTRDSSAKEDQSDTILALIGERAPNGLVANPRMALRKVRGGACGEEIAFTPKPIELPIAGDATTPRRTLVLVWETADPAAPTPKTRQWPKSLRVFQRALDQMLSDLGKRMRPFVDGPEVLAVRRDLVRDEFLKAYSANSQEAKAKAFARCVDRALQESLICSREIGGVEQYWRI